jgi:HemY protein
MRYFYFLILFAVLVLFGLAGLWMVQNNSPLQVVWLGYEIRTSVAFLILGLFALSILFVFIGVALIWLIRLPSRTFSAFGNRRHDQGLQLLTQGLIAFSAGQYDEALALTHKAAKRLPNQPLLPTIVSAEIARASGNTAEIRKNYSALLQHKETEFVALKGLMVQAQKDKNYAEMLSLGQKAKRLEPKDLGISALLFQAYKQQRRWQEAEIELDQLAKGLKKSPEQQEALLSETEEGTFARQKGLLLFQRGREAYTKYQVKDALSLVLKAMQYLPSLPPLYVLAAQIAPEANMVSKVRRRIEDVWRVEPHPDIAKAFNVLFSTEPAPRRVRYAEKLAELNPEHVESHRLIATAAISARDFVKARNHVKAALSIEETASLCQIMAHIAAEERDLEQAEQWRKRAMLAVPDHFWVCSECNFHTLNWDIFCSSCGSWDSYQWELPHNSHHHLNQEHETLLLTNVINR